MKAYGFLMLLSKKGR